MLNVKPEFPVEPKVLAVLEHIRTAAAALRLQYLMIGAQALDMQLHNVHGLPTFRPTNDTDFGVAIENWEQFTALKAQLEGTGYFKPDGRRAQRLEYAGDFPVDLVPFGGIESPAGTVAWPPDRSPVMTVLGFVEINAAAETIAIPGSAQVIRAASLPGLSILKLFAWNDRSETKDAWDLAALLQNYNYAVGDARLFSEGTLLKSVNFDTIKAGAVLLGKDAAGIAGPKALSAAQKILLGPKRPGLVSQLASGLRVVAQSNRLSTAADLLTAFQTGLGTSPTPPR